jgi:hypothetical protein
LRTEGKHCLLTLLALLMMTAARLGALMLLLL